MNTFFKGLVWLAVFVFFALAGGAGYFSFVPSRRVCVTCHEIQKSRDHWAVSAHRDVDCKACHGSSLGTVHAVKENVTRLWRHVTEKRVGAMRLSEDQVLQMNARCGVCHAQEYARWKKNGHSSPYEKFLADKKHNDAQKPADQCLRCHGMFYEGQFSDLMTRRGTNTLWTFCDPSMAEKSSISCLSCHAGHTEPAVATNGVFMYSRPEKCWFAAKDLYLPRVIREGKPVGMSQDARSRLCVQCHAPLTGGASGSGDDRTPTGVHEGIACTTCHDPHSGDTGGSCLQCHPKFSRCKEKDVRLLDTTFRSAKSPHDVHHLTCVSCHAKK